MNGFKQKFKYYIKDTLLSYTFMVAFSVTAFLVILAVGNGTDGIWAVLTGVFCWIFYFLVIFNSYKKTGEEAMRMKHGNDVERRHMLETKVYRELDKVKEYNGKKQYFFALWAILPSLLFLILKIVFDLFGGSGGINLLYEFIYSPFYAFAYGIDKNANLYLGAIGLIYLPLPVIIGYDYGVYKVNGEYRRAEKLQKELGGEK